MKEIVVISGKGGTGKTSIVASFAALAKNAVLADCDVDAADLHLILNPDVKQTVDFSGGKSASIITDNCIGCGRCKEVCNFNAVTFDGQGCDAIEKTFTIDPVSCEGCGVCVHFCPVNAIEFKEVVNGQWFVSETRFGPMVHARLGIAQENSGKLVSLIRKESKRISTEQNRDVIIVDGSPGIGCPVIASIAGADLVLVVTEPTISGRHDLERVIDLTEHFKIPAAICINKYDINIDISDAIRQQALKRNVKIVGEIAYDSDVTRAQIAGVSITEFHNEGLKKQVVSMWESILNMLNTLDERKESINDGKYIA